MSHRTSWRFPAQCNKADQSPRRVGVEIEFQGIEIAALAALVADQLNGDIKRISSAEYEVNTTDHGAFRIELDFALLQDLARRREQSFDPSNPNVLDRALELLGEASAVVVPCEIVSPPIAMGDLPEIMDPLIDRLRASGARGTRQSVVFAFGVHLNVEPPQLGPSTVLDYLRAFVCLYDWIADDGEVDISRRLSPYIDRYPKAYELLIAAPDYAPDWSQLIDDYIEHNPTRDRAMDMLPMLTHVDEDRVRSAVDDALIKPRPTFHYRLANSCVDEPDWSLAQPWNRWVQVEQLANDRDKLMSCLEAFSSDRDRLLRGIDKRWIQEVQAWLTD